MRPRGWLFRLVRVNSSDGRGQSRPRRYHHLPSSSRSWHLGKGNILIGLRLDNVNASTWSLFTIKYAVIWKRVFSTHYEDVLEPNQIRAFLLQRYFHFHPAKLRYYPLNEKLMIEIVNETD